MRETYLNLLLCLSFTVSLSLGLRCVPPPSPSEIEHFLEENTIVVQARLQEKVPLQTSNQFDVVALVTRVLSNPRGVEIPPRILIRRFYKPTLSPSLPKFGCLENFQSYSKFTFLLFGTGEKTIVRGGRLAVFELAGPVFEYHENNNFEIMKALCKTCYSPKLNAFGMEIRRFGDNFNITCVAEGNPLPEVLWYRNNYPLDTNPNGRDVSIDIVQINDETKHAILEIDNLILLDNGNYVCKAKNDLGRAESVLQLRVTLDGVSLTDPDTTPEENDYEACPEEENFCFNDGECFFKKSNPMDRHCNCPTGFMGDLCQFRTSGIVLSSASVGTVSTLWLQIILQFVFIAIIGIIVIAIVLVFRRKDRHSRGKRKITDIKDVLCKSQYVQVNTIEPPPPPITSHLNSTSPSPSSSNQSSNFWIPAVPKKPQYAPLPTNVFMLDSSSLQNYDTPPEQPINANHLRITNLQRPQRANVNQALLEPIDEGNVDSSVNFAA